MEIAIRAASLCDDRQELIALLERNISEGRAEFRWRHEDNPAGPGWSWIAYDRNSGAASAMASVIPRQMYVDGKLILCGQVTEFVVDATHRSLGPAVLLQRATFEPANRGDVAFCYDCPPHDRGMSTFVRLGMHANCEVVRYALLLRSDEFFGKRLGDSVWSRSLVATANVGLKIRTPNLRPVPGVDVSKFDGEFGEEFSHLDKLISSPGLVRACRSAELLNWRYRKNPVHAVRVLVARKAGELLGFLAFIVFGERRASICDLFVQDSSDAGIALLEAMIQSCRQENVNCVQGYCSETSSLRPLFEKVGLRRRETAVRVVAYAKPDGLGSRALNSGLRWPIGQVEVGM